MKPKHNDKNVHSNKSKFENLVSKEETDRAFTMMYIVPASLYAWSVCSPLDSIGNFCDYAVNVAGCWLALSFLYTICIAAASVVLEGVAKKYDVGKMYIFVRRILYFALTFGITYFLVEKCGIRITM